MIRPLFLIHRTICLLCSTTVAALSLILCLLCCNTVAAQSATIERLTMGWSSWNTYRVNINDSLIMCQADAMVSQGLHKGLNTIRLYCDYARMPDIDYMELTLKQ